MTAATAAPAPIPLTNAELYAILREFIAWYDAREASRQQVAEEQPAAEIAA